jgi:hypothetical protein
MIALFDNEEVGSNSSMVRAAPPRCLPQSPPAGWRMPAVCVCIIGSRSRTVFALTLARYVLFAIRVPVGRL